MFRYAQDGCVRWPLVLQQVQEDGSTAEQSVTVTFVRLTRAERKQRDAAVFECTTQFRALLPTDGADDTPEKAAQRTAISEKQQASDDAELRQRVKGWSGLADQSGAPLSFSAELLEAFLNDDLLRDLLLNGLLAASAGAQTKNSLPGLAGLPVPAQA